MFFAVLQLYRDQHEDAQNVDQFRRKAQENLPDPLTHYTLREEDLRFITPSASVTGAKTSTHPATTFDDLATAPSLVYRSAWEFVAERFHCDEPFLRELNGAMRGEPKVGSRFVVPNVIPFEVENTAEGSLQPAVDAEHPVTAAFVELTRLEISRDGKLIAVMPTGLARPDLRGRGSWTVLDAIPRPRLATLRESKDQAAATSGLDAGAAAPAAVLATEQFLASGPNNPVGVVWINLAKAKSTEPLPYGLHGTSIPSRMKTQEGIGGIRLANWDIVRAVRLLPPGTPLQWR
jgi:lipoprotein-anchoring transpeptidase ErfK/SrfK